MAYIDTVLLEDGEGYALGEYEFHLERTSVPGSINDKIEAICTKDGKNTRKSIQVSSSTQLGGWYVEANETEATVYALINKPKESEEGEKSSDLIDYSVPVIGGYYVASGRNPPYDRFWYSMNPANSTMGFFNKGENGFLAILASSDSGVVEQEQWYGGTFDISLTNRFTYNEKTVYYDTRNRTMVGTVSAMTKTAQIPANQDTAKSAWTLIYGTSVDPEYEEVEIMVGRFAIDLKDAGGDGPGSNWGDPGDYDDDWEEGDPTHTLYVTVTGALSGRHNDPIEDQSYSYIPADKDTVKGYGYGGDGGHGGGGGAGAATVVVHKFATDKADSKEVTAIARRHGYGSGGGKGGKGGDGCILVYY